MKDRDRRPERDEAYGSDPCHVPTPPPGTNPRIPLDEAWSLEWPDEPTKPDIPAITEEDPHGIR